VLRPMTDVPVGTIGFEAVGEVDDDDWEEAVEPVLRREIADGRKCACCTCSARPRVTSKVTRSRLAPSSGRGTRRRSTASRW
jgi:hypothetical protein